MDRATHREIEHLLQQLIHKLETILPPKDAALVREYEEVGEYGLALDTAVLVIIEEDKKVPR